ncbi:hypothetical protein GCM10028808_63290 [Spirosoma migulaei]
MPIRLRQYWQQLQESLRFVPGLLVLASFGLAYGLVGFDAHTSWHGEKQFPLLFASGADGARGMLSAIAGSMLTVAALAFSLTLATISQVSSQYSPRVLRNFMRDRVNQVVMGYFVGVFSYCLIVLGTIRGTDEVKFVPSTAVLAGLLLALGGVAALIFFIHHIAESLQTGTIVQHIFHETNKAIDELFPDQFGEPIDDPQKAKDALDYADEQAGWRPVIARQTGYLQQINTDGLLSWATRHRVVLRIEKEMGAFIGEGSVLFSVRSGMERPEPEEADWPNDLMDYVSIGRHRNVEQDVAFGIQQLVDITSARLANGWLAVSFQPGCAPTGNTCAYWYGVPISRVTSGWHLTCLALMQKAITPCFDDCFGHCHWFMWQLVPTNANPFCGSKRNCSWIIPTRRWTPITKAAGA